MYFIAGKNQNEYLIQILHLTSIARSSLDSDLSDTALKYWTTGPNLLFVATLSGTGQVVGCIGYREMSQSTDRLKLPQV